MNFKKIGMFVAAFMFVTAATADTLEVNENHPQKYVVQKGDTLWDISAKFLKKPWYWPKIWNVNPQVEDPHWIYPGDVLTLVWIDGQPYLKKVTPDVKVATSPIPTIDADKVKTFLKNDVILPYDEEELAKIPFVLGHNDGRAIMAQNADIYIKGQLNKGQQYGVYHKGELYKDEKGNKLGYRAEYVGAIVAGEQFNKQNKSMLVKNFNAVKLGDYVLPYSVDTGYNLYFTPAPATVDTVVIGMGDNGTFAGIYSTVVLGKGSKDGVKSGDVFSLVKPGLAIAGNSADDVEYTLMASAGKQLASLRENVLPDELVGQAMVYRTYEHASLALVMISKGEVKVGFKAVRP